MRWFGFSILFFIFFAVSCSSNTEPTFADDDTPSVPEVFVRSAPVVFTEINPKNISLEDEALQSRGHGGKSFGLFFVE